MTALIAELHQRLDAVAREIVEIRELDRKRRQVAGPQKPYDAKERPSLKKNPDSPSSSSG